MLEEMYVILGAGTVKAYVTSTKDFQVIGIVRFGQEYGLLATDIKGAYFRVNGSSSVELHTPTVMLAIAAAREAGIGNFIRYKAARIPKLPATVTLRKHRHYQLNEHTFAS
jgi:hypothetical protein